MSNCNAGDGLIRHLAWIAVLLCSGCSSQLLKPGDAQLEQIRSLRSTEIVCQQSQDCADPNVFAELPVDDQQRLITLERGDQALAARLHLIRGARERIELQTFILRSDHSGRLILEELLQAARRGVQVRVLADQLFSLDDAEMLSALATAHVGLDVRLYNPTFGKAETSALDWLGSIVCCFLRVNQRMHNKLMVVDNRYAITGGRNVEDRYFDLAERLVYRDRDVLVVGDLALQMRASFDEYFAHPLSVPIARLRDVAGALSGVEQAAPWPAALPEHISAPLLEEISTAAADPDVMRRDVLARARSVRKVEFWADPPGRRDAAQERLERNLSERIRSLLGNAEREVLIQTPYLVLSAPARATIRRLRSEHPDIDLIISTNSLASTDAFYVYALSYKRKARYTGSRMRLKIHEFRPQPALAATLIRALPAVEDASASIAETTTAGDRLRQLKPRPGSLLRLRSPEGVEGAGLDGVAGRTISLHSKSMVIDRRVTLIGSHNFDPRSDELNTECGLIINDAAFAEEIRSAIRTDIRPENSWIIARRPPVPFFAPLLDGVGSASYRLPIFDPWPFRRTSSFEPLPDAPALPPYHPDFFATHRDVGPFPETSMSLKQIQMLLVTAFFGWIEPIL